MAMWVPRPASSGAARGTHIAIVRNESVCYIMHKGDQPHGPCPDRERADRTARPPRRQSDPDARRAPQAARLDRLHSTDRAHAGQSRHLRSGTADALRARLPARARAAREPSAGPCALGPRREGRLQASMTALVWEETPLTKHHDRAVFDCGDNDLNIYLQRYARQNHDSGGAKCFVAVPADEPARVLGFYTLSPASIEY